MDYLTKKIKSVAPAIKGRHFVPFITQGDQAHAIHSDGVGMKSLFAYNIWKRDRNPSILHNLAEDAIVMNIDDLACSGFTDNYLVSCIINRNPKLIDDSAVAEVIEGFDKYIKVLRSWGVNIHYVGGETADMAGQHPPLLIDCSISSSCNTKDLVQMKIKEGDAVMFIDSNGTTSYDDRPNSGIGSNGFTELLNHTFDEDIERLLLNPTRTYLPFIKKLYKFVDVKGVVHVTGGGHNKISRFTNLEFEEDFGRSLIYKDPMWVDLQKKGLDMSKFNCGYRLQVYIDLWDIPAVLSLSDHFGYENSFDTMVGGYSVYKKQKK